MARDYCARTLACLAIVKLLDYDLTSPSGSASNLITGTFFFVLLVVSAIQWTYSIWKGRDDV